MEDQDKTERLKRLDNIVGEDGADAVSLFNDLLIDDLLGDDDGVDEELAKADEEEILHLMDKASLAIIFYLKWRMPHLLPSLNDIAEDLAKR